MECGVSQESEARSRVTSHLVRVLLGILLMGVLGTGVLAYAFTEDRAVLVRNSLVIQGASESDFLWRPDAPPPGYLAESRPVPDLFQAVADSLRMLRGSNGSFDMEAAELLVGWIHRTPGDERPIRANTKKTYRLIVDEGWGYCADYTRTSIAILHALNVPVRHWGTGMGDLGAAHTFLEIFVEEYDDWVFLDPFFAFYVRSPESGRPLSALEFRDALLDESSPDPRVEVIGDGIFGFPNRESILIYYRSAAEFFYLIWGNNVFELDEHPLTTRLSSVSRSAELLAAMALGIYPQIRPLPAASEAHAAAVQEIRRVRLTMFLAAFAMAILAAWVLVEMIRTIGALRRGRT